MRIHVLGAETFGRQAGTYAEYRVFAALTQRSDRAHVRHARVVLRRTISEGRGDGVSCTVAVAFDDESAARIRATSGHAYAAINRAAERLERR